MRLHRLWANHIFAALNLAIENCFGHEVLCYSYLFMVTTAGTVPVSNKSAGRNEGRPASWLAAQTRFEGSSWASLGAEDQQSLAKQKIVKNKLILAKKILAKKRISQYFLG